MNTNDSFMEMLRSHPEIGARIQWLIKRDGRGREEFYRATGVNVAALDAASRCGRSPNWRTIVKVLRAFPDREDRLFLLLGEGDVEDRRPLWRPWADRNGLVVDEGGDNGRIIVASAKWGTVESVVVYKCSGGVAFPDGSGVGVEVRRGDRQETMSFKEFEKSRSPDWWCLEHSWFQSLPGPWAASLPDCEK